MFPADASETRINSDEVPMPTSTFFPFCETVFQFVFG
jgi:hypothetical protein